jgi:hypothetical protein
MDEPKPCGRCCNRIVTRWNFAWRTRGKGFKDPTTAAKRMGLRVMTYCAAGIVGGSLELVQSSGIGVRIICRIG